MPTGRARGTVLEAHLDKGRGPVATVLVQRGTLEVGDALVAGPRTAKIRAMQDENGQTVERRRARPSRSQILGWNHVPSVGRRVPRGRGRARGPAHRRRSARRRSARPSS